ncbi:DUF4091 domain-containing protein, partial [PVC group bacterium]|nr:DUF4091 domain-containing protein [PVC group bacterium]
MRQNVACLSWIVLLASNGADAAEVLFSFEGPAEIVAWRIRSTKQDTLTQSPHFATHGRSSACFATPAWRQGLEQWPAFEVKPAVRDWRLYDRLVVDITNPDEERYFLALFVSDSKVPFRKGLSYRFDLRSKGFKRFVIPLSKLPKSVERSDISILHFFGQRPRTAMRLHLDSILLLRQGETIPDPPPQFVKQLVALCLDSFGSSDQLISQCRQTLAELCDSEELKEHADQALSGVMGRIRAIESELKSPAITLTRMEELQVELAQLPRTLERAVSVLRFQRAYAQLGMPANGMLVGFATSMEKILPRDLPFELTATRQVEVGLARNEKESFQIAVLPVGQALEKVSVHIGDLRTAEGNVFEAKNIDCDVMGYVETKHRPPYEASYVGWWPDPILDFLGPIDIAAGVVQTFWIRCRAPKEQPPGLYRGTIRVTAAGVEPLTFGLTIKVHSFTLPDHTPLPTAITFFERKRQMGGEEHWPRMKFAYADFLADYYIDYDSLYRRDAPDLGIIKHLHDQGRLVAFNLGNVFNAGIKAKNVDAAITGTVDRLRYAYGRAKQLGVLDHAYIYGFDERGKGQFPLLEQCAAALRRAFPEVLLMTTSYDHSFGLDSVVKTIDAWCPLTPRFDMEKAAKARASAKKVWWYICCGPRNPYANWFVEYAAIEARLLMGAMTAKYRPDGFLYYSLSIWNKNEPIEAGPFTDWNPVSWTTYHGDGSLFCSGPGGKPVPTIRLENYRDGMEDFA